MLLNGQTEGHSVSNEYQDDHAYAGQTYLYKVDAVDNGGNTDPKSRLSMVVLPPALGRARQHAMSIVCRNHLKSLATANATFSVNWDERYAPVIDETMVAKQAFSWNSNTAFRKYIALNNDANGRDRFVLPEEYWCPEDRVFARRSLILW